MSSLEVNEGSTYLGFQLILKKRDRFWECIANDEQISLKPMLGNSQKQAIALGQLEVIKFKLAQNNCLCFLVQNFGNHQPFLTYLNLPTQLFFRANEKNKEVNFIRGVQDDRKPWLQKLEETNRLWLNPSLSMIFPNTVNFRAFNKPVEEVFNLEGINMMILEKLKLEDESNFTLVMIIDDRAIEV